MPKSEAKKWEAAQTLEDWQAENSATPSICWLDFLTSYLEMSQEKYCRKTWLEKRLAPKLSLRVIGPNTEAETIRPQDALSILRFAAKTSGNAANKVRKNLAAAWAWGIRYCGLPPNNPFKQCGRFPADRHPRRALSRRVLESV